MHFNTLYNIVSDLISDKTMFMYVYMYFNYVNHNVVFIYYFNFYIMYARFLLHNIIIFYCPYMSFLFRF